MTASSIFGKNITASSNVRNYMAVLSIIGKNMGDVVSYCREYVGIINLLKELQCYQQSLERISYYLHVFGSINPVPDDKY